jgi:hypothetical protein
METEKLVWVRWASTSNEWFLGVCKGKSEDHSYNVMLQNGECYCVPPVNIKEVESEILEIVTACWNKRIESENETSMKDEK